MQHLNLATSTIGGVLIGLGAVTLLILNGRIAGISGITGSLFSPRSGDVAWRMAFVAGIIGTGVVASFFAPESFEVGVDRSVAAVVVAGLLVGFGTRLGSGCTSGHGVCGLARLSARSMVSVVTFITAGAATVWVTRVFLGGAL